MKMNALFDGSNGHHADIVKPPIDAVDNGPCLRHPLEKVPILPWLDKCFSRQHVSVFPKPNPRFGNPVKLLERFLKPIDRRVFLLILDRGRPSVH